jgi:formate/nitrite transporter FocA (FNT family)
MSTRFHFVWRDGRSPVGCARPIDGHAAGVGSVVCSRWRMPNTRGAVERTRVEHPRVPSRLPAGGPPPSDERMRSTDDPRPHESEDAEEQDDAKERSAPPGHVLYAAIRREGEDELSRQTNALAWSGLAAGLSMGFSFVLEGVLRSHLPEAEWRPLIVKLGYPLGFLLVVLGRQQLFTENTLTVVLPLMTRKDLRTALNVARLWTVVLASNLVGAAIFAWACTYHGAFDEPLRRAFLEIGREAMRADVLSIFVRAIFGGWLIALMVWLLPFAETGRVAVIVIVTYVVGVGEFSHVIAGSVESMHLTIVGEKSWFDYLFGFLVPTLAGNTLGGVSLVAALAHAQFAERQPDAARG